MSTNNLNIPTDHNNNSDKRSKKGSVSIDASSDDKYDIYNIWIQSANGFNNIPRHSAFRKAPSLYCRVVYEDSDIYETRHIRASYTPEWWDSFDVHVDPELAETTQLKCEIWDYHRFSRHILIGEAIIHLKEIDDTISIYDLNQHVVGHLKVSVRRNDNISKPVKETLKHEYKEGHNDAIPTVHNDSYDLSTDDDNELVTLQHPITMHTDDHISPTGEDDLLDIITQAWSKYFGLLFTMLNGNPQEEQRVTLRSLREAHIRKRTITLCSIATTICIMLRIVHWQVFILSLIAINFACRYLVINRRNIMRSMLKKSMKRRSNNVRLWLKSKFKKHKKSPKKYK